MTAQIKIWKPVTCPGLKHVQNLIIGKHGPYTCNNPPGDSPPYLCQTCQDKDPMYQILKKSVDKFLHKEAHDEG